MFSSAWDKYDINSNLTKKLWTLVSLLILVAFAVESATTNRSETKNICSTTGCKDAAKLLKGNMDLEEKPCNDFYKFACGGFLKNASIPNDKYHVGHMSMLQDKIVLHIKELLDERIDPNEPRIFELAKSYYRSCLDESTRQQNLDALLKIIKELGGWPLLEGSKWNEGNFDLFDTDRKLRNIGYPPNRIFRFFTFPNLLNTSRSLLFIGPPNPLIKSEILSGAFMNPTVQAYYNFMFEIAVLLGANKRSAQIHLKKVIEFEKQLITGVQKQSVLDNLNPKLVKELYEEVADDYPWLEYINNMTKPVYRFKNRSIINVVNPAYLQKVVYTLDNTPKKIVADYMIWKVIAESLMYLPDKFREKSFEFDKIRSERKAPPRRLPRWKECIALMTDKEGGLAVAVSSMYIRKYFIDATRKQVEPIVSSVADAFRETINKTTWMSAEVKAAALKKVELMRKIIAYPDELLNDQKIDEYSRSLEISPNDHFQNFLNLKRFHYDFDLSNLGKSTNVNLWEFFSDSTTVNAYYYSLANTFVLLAAILQRPLFNPEWPSYATFGSMGFIIGHEIMHAYDAHRVMYDATGALTGWMKSSSKSTFLNRSQCFMDQYSSYTDKQTDMKLNGGLTLNENVADTSGLKIAYRAYRNWVEKHGEDPRPSELQQYSADQLFFVSAINFLCGKSTKEKRNDDLKNDAHTPDDFRTLGMLSNSEDFAQIYSCAVGSRMNPSKKCAIWE